MSKQTKLADLKARRLVPFYDLPRERVALAKATAEVARLEAVIARLEADLARYDLEIGKLEGKQP